MLMNNITMHLLFLSGLLMGSLAANIPRIVEFELDDDLEVFETSLIVQNNSIWREDYQPTEIEVNTYNEKVRTIMCDNFDTSTCGNEICLLGYETDSYGCVVNCQCKNYGLFEGDIMVEGDDELEKLKVMYGLSSAPRGASRSLLSRWYNIKQGGKYIVPYVRTPEIRANKKAVVAIILAMREFTLKTNVKFRPRRKGENDFLKFIVGDGCYSHIGRKEGCQLISIGKRCEFKGTVMHELMHAIGFFHEQSRPDRDGYVLVMEENILEGRTVNFEKMSYDVIDSMGSPYDFQSLLHYGGFDFSKDRLNLKTLVYKKTGEPVEAQRDGFSEEDLIQINKMYY